jgi:HK97 family phage portal protein
LGWLDSVLRRNSELEFMFDLDMFQESTNRVYMKKLAVDTCVSFLGRTISQSEFRINDNGDFRKDDLYYRLNVRPNKNQTASTFWETFIHKLIYDNECLIIQSDEEDLLIADDYMHNEYAVYEDTFTNVIVRGYEFKRSFRQSEVIHLKYRNEKLSPLIDGLFADYGELFGKILSAQMRKGQIRGSVNMDMITNKSKEQMAKFQEFVDNMYKSIYTKDVAITPQQKGVEYKEEYNGSSSGASVDEVNKVTNGFLDQVAMALGIPVSLIHGNMADIEKNTKNYMMFAINPLIKKIKDESNVKFFTQEEYLSGKKVDIKPISFNNLFDLATSIDKLVSSGAFTGNEIRLEAGYEKSKDPKLDKHFITKNYTEMQPDEGGDNE